MEFDAWVQLAAQILEGIGVATILAGAFVPLVVVGVRWSKPDGRRELYRAYRNALGRGIMLGLEFLVGADIIRTVAEHPTLRSVTVLAIVVLIRTFLSFTLAAELEGQWPWLRKSTETE